MGDKIDVSGSQNVSISSRSRLENVTQNIGDAAPVVQGADEMQRLVRGIMEAIHSGSLQGHKDDEERLVGQLEATVTELLRPTKDKAILTAHASVLAALVSKLMAFAPVVADKVRAFVEFVTQQAQ